MTEREKVIEGLGKVWGAFNHMEHELYADYVYDALALLKAQEPIEPVVCGDGASFEKARTWWYACGACNKAIDMADQYCRHCGRAVKWE